MKTLILSASGKQGIAREFPYEEMRPLQRAALEEISRAWDSGVKYVFLEAPTGFGKSAIAITLARQNPAAFILVSTKNLQDQYVREGAFEAIDVRGRGNFSCLVSRDKTCDAGPCRLGMMECRYKPQRSLPEKIPERGMKLASSQKGDFWKYQGSRVCPYWEQKCWGLNHDYPVMSYSYFLYESTHPKDFGKRNLMVCDEAHNMEEELMRFIEFTISDNDLKLVNSRIPRVVDSIGDWVDHINKWKRSLAEEFESTKEKFDEAEKKTEEMMEKMQNLADRIEKCSFISGELSVDPDNWIIERGEKGLMSKVTFRPIFVSEWASKFFSMAERFLLQSATIIDAESMASGLGLDESECAFLRAGSDFLPEKRPIYYRPVGRMSHGEIGSTLPRMADAIRELLEKYPDKKGVVHTHTYNIQEYIAKHVQTRRFLMNRQEDSRNRGRIIADFIRSPDPVVLLTPSAYEGMDFKDDICRWQVICKMPYPNLGNKQVEKRMSLDRNWYQWKTVLRLVQTYGRGIRSREDWCDTYIFDSSFSVLLKTGKDLFPKWFTEAIVRNP
ncbi:MAG: DEAD/DEAH box helicase family protein [Candidatus Aenigmarchaeota archaeon]|nr:DEAD/DEAH box helicase family protein [Candidatus Aenigmarchaeota archaeon]